MKKSPATWRQELVVRVIACDDGEVRKLGEGYTIAVCTRWSNEYGLEDLTAAPIPVDGSNATNILLNLVNKIKYNYIIHAILLDSITIAGFNYINIERLSSLSSLPVITVYTYKPRFDRLFKAMKIAGLDADPDRINSLKIINNIIHILSVKGNLYILTEGVNATQARRILSQLQAFDRKPIPLRLAHYIASALSRILSL